MATTFNFGVFGTAVRILLTRRPLRWRRVTYAAGLVAACTLLFVVTRVSLWLDQLFYPRFRQTPITQPLFITGIPRTGTTLMQKLISLDTVHFAPTTLADLLVPSLTLRRLIGACAAVDRWLGGGVTRLVRAGEQRVTREMRGIHPWALHEPEEDVFLTLHCFALSFVYLFVPDVCALQQRGHHPEWFDDLEPRQRARLLAFYEGCVQRHLFAAGGGKRLVVKNTTLVAGIRSYLERFPEAKIVAMVRRPHECLASMSSLTHTMWRQFDPDAAKPSADIHALVEQACQALDRLMRYSSELPPDRLKIVRYEDFLADPYATIASLYRWMGLPMTPAYAARLKARIAQERHYRSTHAYSAAEFGLPLALFVDDLAPVYKHFGWALPGPEDLQPGMARAVQVA